MRFYGDGAKVINTDTGQPCMVVSGYPNEPRGEWYYFLDDYDRPVSQSRLKRDLKASSMGFNEMMQMIKTGVNL